MTDERKLEPNAYYWIRTGRASTEDGFFIAKRRANGWYGAGGEGLITSEVLEVGEKIERRSTKPVSLAEVRQIPDLSANAERDRFILELEAEEMVSILAFNAEVFADQVVAVAYESANEDVAKMFARREGQTVNFKLHVFNDQGETVASTAYTAILEALVPAFLSERRVSAKAMLFRLQR